MAKLYDISSKITNELPTLKITDDIIVTINNKTKTVLNVQAMAKETIKNKDNEDDNEDDSEFEFIKKVLTMLIGAKKANEIEKLDLPMPEYKTIHQTIMDIAIGAYEEETPKQ